MTGNPNTTTVDFHNTRDVLSYNRKPAREQPAGFCRGDFILRAVGNKTFIQCNLPTDTGSVETGW